MARPGKESHGRRKTTPKMTSNVLRSQVRKKEKLQEHLAAEEHEAQVLGISVAKLRQRKQIQLDTIIKEQEWKIPMISIIENWRRYSRR